MKRDMDLVRRILLAVEEHDEVNSDSPPPELEDVARDTLARHLLLLEQGGLLDALDAGSMQGPSAIATGLRWEGHDFLDDVRDPSVWRDTMKQVGGVVGSASLAVIRAVAEGVVKAHLGLS